MSRRQTADRSQRRRPKAAAPQPDPPARKKETNHVVLVYLFLPAGDDEEASDRLADAEVMVRKPGIISTKLHRAIGASPAYLNYAVWESTDHFVRPSRIPSSGRGWRTILRHQLPRRPSSR